MAADHPGPSLSHLTSAMMDNQTFKALGGERKGEHANLEEQPHTKEIAHALPRSSMGATRIRLPVSIIFFAPIRKVYPRRESLGSDRN